MSSRRPRLAYVFVCQSGPLEIKALLLAASLARHLGPDSDLIAAIPSPEAIWGAPAARTLELLADMGAAHAKITNEIDARYPIGNKVSCLKVATDCDRLVFLDTDMLMVRPCTEMMCPGVSFAAKPSDLPNMIDARKWRRAYGAAGVRMPGGRVATTVYGQIVLPYFNAGFIAVDPSVGLGATWLECCRKIDAKWGVGPKRPHLDQIALPVAVAKLQLQYACLDQRYNFPAHLKAVDPLDPPFFAHYHTPEVLRREPILVDLVRSLCADSSALEQAVRGDAAYAPMLSAPRRLFSGVGRLGPTAPSAIARSRPAAVAEIIITGIPRSGTSYLCNLLHRFGNCVVLNEPPGIARPLRKEPIPYGVGTFFRDVRRDVLEGKPILNKLRDGQVTEETMVADDLTEYRPPVENDNFVLGVKNPLGFLSRLRSLRKAMPRARIVACARNPLDTIASWKTSFSHLKDANVSLLLHGGLRDPFLSPRMREALEEVSRIKEVAWRRAAWWRYLAELMIDAAGELIIVPYSQAVSDPTATAERILRGYASGSLNLPLQASSARTAKRSTLDQEDYQAIRALCGEAAQALGVNERISSLPEAAAPALEPFTQAEAAPYNVSAPAFGG